jgi:phosphoribosylformylglycinamidine synthase
MKKFHLKVRIRLKDGILDPEAIAISKALERLEFSSIKKLKTEKVFHLEIEAESEAQALDQAREAATKLLTNVVMENFDVEALS